MSKIGLCLISILLLRLHHRVVPRACSVGGTPVGREVLGFVDSSTHESAVEALVQQCFVCDTRRIVVY